MNLKFSEKLSSGFLKIVKERCNNFLLPGSIRNQCHHFYVDGHHVGFVRPDHLKILLNYPETFFIKEDEHRKEIHLNKSFDSYEKRSDNVHDVLMDIHKKGLATTLKGWRNEFFDVWTTGRKQSLMKIERSAACMFGIVTYGTHINGYVNHPKNGLCVWTARRSPTKPTYPNMLDQMVAGGLTVGLDILECARKECGEEASIPDHLLDRLKPVGSVSYCFNDPNRGLLPGIEYCFDLEVPESFSPQVSDGEVNYFELLPVETLMEKIITDEFKKICSLVNLDFLIRHGVIHPDNEPNYAELVQWIHPNFPWA